MKTARKAAVVGAGNMGSGIAQKIATEGVPVVLVDMNEDLARGGMERIQTLLAEGVERRIFSPEKAKEIAGRVTPSGSFDALADCDLVIEAVFEDKKVKKDVFAKVSDAVREDAIIATNTSSFRVDDLADAVKRPERFLGLHYFYHPAKNRLVEVISGKRTAPAAFEAAWRTQELIGKTPIRSEDAPGFIVNRYFVPWLNESVRILEDEDADIPTIEAAAKEAFAIGMGPFELMNVTGVPIAKHAATTLGDELGSFYAPADRLVKQVAMNEFWDLSGEADAGKKQAVADRLLGVVFLVATQMVDEGVCSIEDCDIGARVGLRWSKGPFELINELGVGKASRLAANVANAWDLSVPKMLAAQAKKGDPFAMRLVDLTVDDGIATVRLNRPDALNALNPEAVAQLAARFDEAAGRDDVKAIVLAGAGKAFVAGADIKFFIDRIEAGQLEQIQHFTEEGQELFRRIDGCKKPVICKLDGLSLGGGTELALCADAIVATERGTMGFPETGIGIYPGLGGTQRTARRAGAAVARRLIYTGDTVDAKTAQKLGLVDEIAGPTEIDARIRELAAKLDPKAEPKEPPAPDATSAFFAEHRVDALLSMEPPADEALAKALKKVRRKAPVALRIAEKCIDVGSESGLGAGLTAELENLKEIFSTKDALEGLKSLTEGRRPAFEGE